MKGRTVHSQSQSSPSSASSPLLDHQIQHSIDVEIRIQTEVGLREGRRRRSQQSQAGRQRLQDVGGLERGLRSTLPRLAGRVQRRRGAKGRGRRRRDDVTRGVHGGRRGELQEKRGAERQEAALLGGSAFLGRIRLRRRRRRWERRFVDRA